MHKQWLGCRASNFRVGRPGFSPEAIVIHRTGGTLAEIDARFQLANTFASAHYAIGKNGDVHQYVEERDTAFHAAKRLTVAWTLQFRAPPGRWRKCYYIGRLAVQRFTDSAGE